jgi:hypothetical protein
MFIATFNYKSRLYSTLEAAEEAITKALTKLDLDQFGIQKTYNVDRFMELVKNGDYQTAMNFWNKEISCAYADMYDINDQYYITIEKLVDRIDGEFIDPSWKWYLKDS